jgi:hypothetical protein
VELFCWATGIGNSPPTRKLMWTAPPVNRHSESFFTCCLTCVQVSARSRPKLISFWYKYLGGQSPQTARRWPQRLRRCSACMSAPKPRKAGPVFPNMRGSGDNRPLATRRSLWR